MTNVTATLVFDSWIDSVPERRSRKSEERHLLYEGGGILLDLLLKPCREEGFIQVGGQILLADSSTGSVAGIVIELKPAGHNFTAETNALGEFVFQAVPRLPLELCIVCSQCSVHVRGLSFDEPHQWQVVSMMEARGAR